MPHKRIGGGWDNLFAKYETLVLYINGIFHMLKTVVPVRRSECIEYSLVPEIKMDHCNSIPASKKQANQ